MTRPRSLDLDLGVVDDFLVFRHLLTDVGRKLFPIRPDWLESERVQALLHVRQRQHFGHLRLQRVGKIAWQALHSPQSITTSKRISFHHRLVTLLMFPAP